MASTTSVCRKQCISKYNLGNIILPFDELKSSEAQNRFSACRPISGICEAGVIGGVPTDAHNTGEVKMRRRATMQVASTLGFVLHNTVLAVLDYLLRVV